MSDELLDILRRQKGHWQGLDALRRELHRSPAEIHRQIEQLQQAGHVIEHSPVNGFRLADGPGTPGFNADQVELGLQTRRVGRKVLVYDVTDSTNDICWAHAQESGYDGLAVFSHAQRSGRGRLGRDWSGGQGQSLLCSILLQDENRVSGAALSLLIGLATAEAIEATARVGVRIKWPNDVLVNNRKLAGTMIESRKFGQRTMFVLGIGVNCIQLQDDFPEEIRNTAISLRLLTAESVDRITLARILLRKLDEWLLKIPKRGPEELKQAWLKRCDQIGQRLTVMQNGHEYPGRVVDVDPEGGLMLQVDDGGVRLFPAESTSVVIR